MSKNIKDVYSLIQNHEGLCLKPYRDTVGKLTIGYGRNLDDVGISEDEAIQLLDNDIKSVIYQLKQHIGWFEKLDEVRQAVLIDMAFNMGIEVFLKFEITLKNIEQSHYKQASIDMLTSKWAIQVGNRAKVLANMMDTGEWPIF